MARGLNASSSYRPKDWARIQSGLCYLCSQPRGPHGTKRLCRPCANKLRDKQRVAKGLVGPEGACSQCGQPRDTIKSKMCRSCRNALGPDVKARLVNLKRLWDETGLCVDCGGERIGTSTRCRNHYLSLAGRNAAIRYGNRHGGSIPVAQMEEVWLKHQGLCHYTGTPISLGFDAEVDHLEPVSLRPDLATDPSNLVFCSPEINRMKGTFPASRFIELCRSVAARHPAPTI